MEEKKENRGAKKGRTITWNTRPTIKPKEEKLKQVQYKAYGEEIEEMNKLLSQIEGKRKYIKLLEAVRYYVKNMDR